MIQGVITIFSYAFLFINARDAALLLSLALLGWITRQLYLFLYQANIVKGNFLKKWQPLQSAYGVGSFAIVGIFYFIILLTIFSLLFFNAISLELFIKTLKSVLPALLISILSIWRFNYSYPTLYYIGLWVENLALFMFVIGKFITILFVVFPNPAVMR